MIYALVSQAALAAMNALLEERGWIDKVTVRVAAPGEGAALLDEAARVPADLLLLDVDTGPALGQAVLRYRLARPHARVVLLAPGRKPGDAEVAAIVAAGVYDVVEDLADLGSVIDNPQGLPAAARWLLLRPEPAAGGGSRAGERVVVQRVGHGAVVVPVVATPGAGGTLVSLMLADYLVRQGQRAAVVQACHEPPWAENWMWERVDGCAFAGRVPVHAPEPQDPNPIAAGVALLRHWHGRGLYQYIVADFGHALAETAVRDEIMRAGVAVAVVPAAAWKQRAAAGMVAAVAELAAAVRVLVTPAQSAAAGRDLLNLFASQASFSALPAVDLSVTPPRPTPESDAALADVLAPVFSVRVRQGPFARILRFAER